MKIQTNTIEELTEYINMWTKGAIQHVYLAGTGGSGKTYTLKEQTKDITRTAYIGDCSPFEFYKALYQYRQADFIVLDDVNRVLKSQDGLRVLKELMGSDKVHWASNRTGKGKELPKQFKIDAQVCVITNEFSNSNSHIQAVRSRAFVIEHCPSAETTIKYAYDNKIITKGMHDKLLNDLFPMPLYLNLRDLEYCNTLRQNKKDWFSMLQENTQN